MTYKWKCLWLLFLNVTNVLKGQPSATTHTHKYRLEMLNKHNHVDKSKH